MRRLALWVSVGLWAASAAAGAVLGPIRQVTGEDPLCQFDPLLAPLRSGGFAVAWDNLQPSSTALLRLADASGRLGPPLEFANRRIEALGSDGAGNLVLLLRGADESYFLQRLSAAGQPLGGETLLPVEAPFGRVAMAVAPDGRAAVVWHRGEVVSGGWFGAQGLVGDVFEIDRAPFPLSGFSPPAAAVDAAGRLVAAWARQSGSGSEAPRKVRFRRFDAAGNAVGPAVEAGSGFLFESAPSLAGLEDGGVAVAWQGQTGTHVTELFLRRFDATGAPLEPPVEVGFGFSPHLASGDGDRLALSWPASLWLVPPTPSPEPQPVAVNPEGARYPYYFQSGNTATVLADGRLAVAWFTYFDPAVLPTGCETAGIFARVIDPAPVAGVPVPEGPEIELAAAPTKNGYSPELAFAPDGGWVAVWESGTCHALVSRAFDAAGQPRGPEFEVAAAQCSSSGSLREISLAALPDGGFVAAWEEPAAAGARLRLRRLGSDGRPVALEQQAGSPGARWPRLAAGPHGFLLAWTRSVPPGTVEAQYFDTQGAATGDPLEIGGSSVGLPDLVAVPGGFVAAWNHDLRAIRSRRLGPTGSPVGEAVTVVADDALDQIFPHLAADAGGGFAVAWTERSERFPFGFGARLRRFGPDDRPREEVIEVENLQDFGGGEEESLLVEDLAASRDGVLLVVLSRRGPLGTYQGDLYGLSVHGGVPVGPATPLAAADSPVTGTVGFASAASDGCRWIVGWSVARPVAPPSIRNRVRRLAGACPAAVPVLDLAGGRFKVEVLWQTPDGTSSFGRALALRDDTGAFWFFGADNPELMVKVLDGRGVNGAFWVFWATLTDVAFDLVVTDTETGARKVYSKPQGRLESRADVNAFPAGTKASLATPFSAVPRWSADRAVDAIAKADAAGCQSGEDALCLDARFLVRVRFVDPRDGVERQALAVPMTSSGGAFWFFGPDNLELMVKTVDGRPVNGSFWFFSAGLSDLDYEITVTDTASGSSRVYSNERGRLASRADTAAFP